MCSFLCYYPALRNDWVWDDFYLIFTHLPSITSLTSLLQPDNQLYWRPVTSLSLLLDYGLWNQDPWGYHLTNILLHGLCGIGLFFLLIHFGQRPVLSLVGVLWFISLPLHLENVVWISGRADILATFWILLYFLSFSLWTEKRDLRLFVVIILFGWFAVLAKEIGLICPILTLLYLGFYKRRDLWRMSLLLSFLVILPPLWLKIRPFYPSPKNLAFTEMNSDLIMNAISSQGFYLAKLFYPYHLQPYIPDIPRSGFIFFLGLVLISAGLGLIWKKRDPRLRLGVTILLISLGMTLPPILTDNFSVTPLAERYLYFPTLVFLCLIMGWLETILGRVREKTQPLILFLFLILVGLNGWLTFSQITVWKDNRVFWEYVKKETGHWFPDYQLGLDYLGRGDLKRSAEHLTLGYLNGGNQYPKLESSYFESRGLIFEREKDFKQAERYLKKSVEIHSYPSNLNHLAQFYLSQYRREPMGKKDCLDLARAQLENGLRLAPNDVHLLFSYALLFNEAGELSKARSFFQQVAEARPNTPEGQKALDWLEGQTRLPLKK